MKKIAFVERYAKNALQMRLNLFVGFGILKERKVFENTCKR
jgi:hypothetical protein